MCSETAPFILCVDVQLFLAGVQLLITGNPHQSSDPLLNGSNVEVHANDEHKAIHFSVHGSVAAKVLDKVSPLICIEVNLPSGHGLARPCSESLPVQRFARSSGNQCKGNRLAF